MMKKRTVIILIAVLAAVALLTAGFFIFRDTAKSDPPEVPAAAEITPEPAAPAEETKSPSERAKELVAQMSEDEKIGQLLMPSITVWRTADGKAQNFTEMNDEIRAVIGDYHLGGIALFLENCADAEQLTHLTYDMQHAAIDAGNLPLLLATDQEGGNISRAKFGTLFSGNMALGASGNPEYAYTAGQIIGKELDAMGINCNFSPVADVNSNEQNPIIGIRSFSGDAAVASEMTHAMAQGLEDGGVISCAKHFPGHGDTSVDSHSGISSVDRTYDEWLVSDGAPFIAAIEDKTTNMIMTAHLQYPKLDDTTCYSSSLGEDIVVPATMSEKILTGILKGDLGFEGVIVTDAMNMGAIEKNFGVNEATVKSIAAGADMILMAINPTCVEDRAKIDSLFADIRAALADGTITRERLNDAVTRIVKLKIEKGILDKDYDFDPDAAAEKAKAIVACPQHREIEHEIALNCVDVFYSGTFAPFSPKEGDTVVCVMTRPADMYSAEHAFLKMEKNGIIPDVDVKYYNTEACWSGAGSALDAEMLQDIAAADYVIVGYYQSAEAMKDPAHKMANVVDGVLGHAATDNVAILWERLPYGTEKYSEKYPCVVLYGSAAMEKEDIGKEIFTSQYGCAIDAGFETIFGVKPKQ